MCVCMWQKISRQREGRHENQNQDKNHESFAAGARVGGRDGHKKNTGLGIRRPAKKRAGAIQCLLQQRSTALSGAGMRGNASHDPQSGDHTYRDGRRDVHFH